MKEVTDGEVARTETGMVLGREAGAPSLLTNLYRPQAASLVNGDNSICSAAAVERNSPYGEVAVGLQEYGLPGPSAG